MCSACTGHPIDSIVRFQGNCTIPPPGQPLNPPITGAQCQLKVAGSFLSTASSLWLHELYLEAVRLPSASAEGPPHTLLEVAGGDVWLTNCMLLGDGVSSRGVAIRQKGRLYARGVSNCTALHSAQHSTVCPTAQPSTACCCLVPALPSPTLHIC